MPSHDLVNSGTDQLVVTDQLAKKSFLAGYYAHNIINFVYIQGRGAKFILKQENGVIISRGI